jgi:hypothetical protein
VNACDKVTSVIYVVGSSVVGAERDGTVAQPIGGEIPKMAPFRANSGRGTAVSFVL